MSTTQDQLSEEELAVLYVLEDRPHLSGGALFTALPRALRNRWSARYLAEVVLVDLARADLVHSERSRDGWCYVLTPQGRLRLRWEILNGA